MRIAFDGHWMGETGGVSTYCRRIFAHIPNRFQPEEYLIATSRPLSVPGEVVLPATSAYIWEQVSFPLHLLKNKVDLAYFPDWRNGAFIPRPYVVTLHDLTFFTHSEYFKKTRRHRLLPLYRLLLGRTLQRARKIITVSHYSKQVIASYYPNLENRIEAIHNGVSERFSPSEASALDAFRNARKLDRPFFLTVGRIDFHKNLIFMAKTFLESKVLKDHLLVLCGSRVNNCYTELVAFLTVNDPEERVRILSDISGDELPLLYGAAELFILTSVSEGFGLTLLEAMACGTPVLAADNTSIPEVVGQGGVLFKTGDAGEFQEKMETIARDVAMRKGLIQAGVFNLKRFSWTASADKTMDILENAG
jgi:glycosyltransferase involved in cell wall biosynthesis